MGKTKGNFSKNKVELSLLRNELTQTNPFFQADMLLLKLALVGV